MTSYRNDEVSENRKNAYSYDMQGNMLSDGDRQYSYDVRNRLAEVRTADGSWQRNIYDGEGLRAELEENGRLVRFIYDGDKAVLKGTDENTIRHIRGYELVSSDSEAAKTYYHYASDELGSVTHVTDEDGNVLNRYEYDAFGNFTLKEETVENRFGFAGEQYDPAANLYYLRARFYNPVIGRFIQEDTYYGDGLNLYTYCHNNPVGYVDPSGHEGICPWKQSALEELRKAGIKEQDLETEYQKFRNKCNTPEQALMAIQANNLQGSGRNTIVYGDLDGLGRPTGIQAIITQDMIKTGTPANQSIRPPGFLGGGKGSPGHARGHLLAGMLGGDGNNPQNLVTIYQRVNNSIMKHQEYIVRHIAEMGGNVSYKVIPIYDGNNLMPDRIRMQAVGTGGLIYDVIFDKNGNILYHAGSK